MHTQKTKVVLTSAIVPVIDCEVSPWGQWSVCDTHCGAGSMVRSRRVVRSPARGGRHCPSLVQRRACQEHQGCGDDSDVPLRARGGRHCPSLVQRRACQEHQGCGDDSDVPLRASGANVARSWRCHYDRNDRDVLALTVVSFL
ncbi:hypothetical protein MSG28_005608 [Choristoneura fumiferana]|uniref:Uncharacterized protein n=1 Tax=Choristoneura fumiferana TaxID=7141 RepID=A0ACC0L0G5_CHOFU|nr:hypothetical protein MSG28_005608 [Choristoneura fumiferana]